MTVFITGIAGFIGTNLARRLSSMGVSVAGADNLCRGRSEHLTSLIEGQNLRFFNADVSDLATYRAVIEAVNREDPIEEIWHLAANSDIPAGIVDADVDLKDTFLTTFNTLKIMREFGISRLLFASSSAIYGDLGAQPLHESAGPVLPISNYGAMKLASEAAISAAVESHLDRAYLFRFPNVIGVPATHGVILDFIAKLQANPSTLDVLGDGSQQKAYLHVDELIDAMLHVRNHADEPVNVFNIGSDDEGVTVRFIAESVVKRVAPGARIQFGEGNKGWVGDVPRFAYCIDKVKQLGWAPQMNSAEAIRRAINEIALQEGIA